MYRNLKTSVLDGERYNDELRGLQQINDDLEAKVQKTLREVNRSKKELNKCRLDLAMPTGKQGGPKINKDTKVKRLVFVEGMLKVINRDLICF